MGVTESARGDRGRYNRGKEKRESTRRTEGWGDDWGGGRGTVVEQVRIRGVKSDEGVGLRNVGGGGGGGERGVIFTLARRFSSGPT